MSKSPHARFVLPVWTNIRAFAGFDQPATPMLWTRWLYLRALGLLFIVIFGCTLKEQAALAGSQGLMPAADYLAQIAQESGSTWSAFFRAPTLFWLDCSDAAMLVVGWLGVIAGVALTLNLWPRLALFGCWVFLLSFVSTWQAFSAAQLDGLMLEVTLLTIPFAPRGIRPGLGSAPWPIALFMMRWLVFRVMFEAGLVKVLAGDPTWRDFTAMEHMYETAPFPTLFGFFDHNMPQAYHVLEILLTYVAELAAPILAFIAGRKGRWIAFFSWTLFQAGIQLTNNFGWLNTASIGLGLLLLDDHMLKQLAGWLRLNRFLPFPLSSTTSLPISSFRRVLRRAALVFLWVHFFFACFYLAKSLQVKVYDLSPHLTAAVNAITPFQSVHEYYLYARVKTERMQVEFAGSNDGGKTWRAYPYKYLAQDETDIAGFIAPRFIRFDATMQILGIVDYSSKAFSLVAENLLRQNPKTLSLFADNPFPDQPPTLLRMRRYRLEFNSIDVWRKTGRYWTRHSAGDYTTPLEVDAQGKVAPLSLAAGEEALRTGEEGEAFSLFLALYEKGYAAAGFRLFDLLMRGIGDPRDPQRAFEIMSTMANDGEVEAINHLGSCYEYGLGVRPDLNDAAYWYRKAADRGLPLGYFNYGSLYARHPEIPSDRVEALACLFLSISKLKGESPVAAFIKANQPSLVQMLQSRMSSFEIAAARQMAADPQHSAGASQGL